ncbi:MAG: UPF0182 family protein [Actinomycetota bacterium]
MDVARVPRPVGGRRWLLIAAAAAAALLIGFTALSGFFVDLLWFREVGYTQVFWTILRTKIALGLIFGAAFFAILYANLLIVRMLTPKYRPLTPDQEVIERYRVAFEPYAWWLLPVIAGVIALFVGFGVTAQWRTFLLWRNSSGVTFGTGDPLFNRDPAFYVFGLPWLEFVQGWLFSSLVGVTFITALAHYLWGGIRPQAPGFGEKVTPQVKAHLSVLLGLIILTKAWGYYLGTFDLLTSKRGVVEGASYTDVRAQLPALRILMFIAVACALLFLVNIRMRGWALPVIAVGLLALVSIAAGGAYPAFVQRFQVGPQELQRELPYIERNIQATREAFGLDSIQVEPRPVADEVTPEGVRDNDATAANIRLWRPDILRENFESLQRIRQYFVFRDVDVDRYELNGERRVVMLSAREVDQDSIPGGGATWQNQHLVYTHGFGAVAAQVNSATPEGAPQFTLSDIPPRGQPGLDTQPRVYYGENTLATSFVVVDTGTEELDYQGSGSEEQVTSTYQGEGGISMGGFLKRALFAWRFRDINLLISGLIEDDSRIMINRTIQERVPKAAPFLEFDGDPYTAIVDGRVVWIWDAYTMTTGYPYSQEVNLDDATPLSADLSGLHGSANYIRNSVKVVVDAYDGTMTYYVADPADPIIQVWGNAFPDLFTPIDQASSQLAAHFRYPENLLQVQASQFANYHVTEPDVFYQKQDFWAVPFDPTVSARVDDVTQEEVPLRPYYLLMRLPGEADETFVLVLPFTPAERQNIVAWMAAKSDPEDYGEIVVFEFPSGENVDGPSQVFSRMQQDARFSADQTLFSQSGSDVRFGDFLIIPISDGLLYVQPVYVRSSQETAIPELKRVLIANGGRLGYGANLQLALNDSFGVAVVPPEDGEPAPGGTVPQQIGRLLQQAVDHFARAEEALRAGDLAMYQSEIEAAQAAIDRASELASRQSGETASPSPTPTPTPAG